VNLERQVRRHRTADSPRLFFLLDLSNECRRLQQRLRRLPKPQHFLLDLSNECRRLQQRLRRLPKPWRWKAVIRTAALKMMMRSPTMDARDCAKPLSLTCCLSPASAARFLVGGSKGQCLTLNQQGSGRRRPRRRCAAYFQLTAPWSGAPLCVLGDRYSEYEIRSPRRRCAAYFQRTAPWFRAPLCVLGDRYSEYEMRSSPPSLRRLLPAYSPLVPSTIIRAWRQVQRVRDEKFSAVATLPSSSVPPPSPEHHYACSETGTAGTR
jgi:hypothetical protein